ncbi:hypothetical protein IWX49DRAFT_257595 [Phyllosticta citricarpa]|uniref:Aminoglycoside phosphotransferase domain-containing protein n=2 Tax=Phyllosticta TaxID=121621 RepID=A0ABR1LS26_9PEZI
MAIHLSSVSTSSADSAAEAKAMGKDHEHDRRDSKADESDWQNDSQFQAPTAISAAEALAANAAAFRSLPDFSVANSDTPAALAYWDAVLDLCTPATLIHAPLGYDEGLDGGELIGRFIFAVGDVVIKTGVMPSEDVHVKRKKFDGVDRNEVEAVALVKKKCGDAVPVADILFAGKLRGSSTLIQRRIEGPTLAAAWPSLTISQRKEFKKQTRILIATLARRVGASPTGKRAYLVDDYASIWARNLTPGERRVMLPPAPPSRPSAVRANSGTVESVRRRDLWGTEGSEQQEAGQAPRSKSFSGGRRDVFASGNGLSTDGFTRGDAFASSNRKPDGSAAAGTGIAFRRGNGFTRGDVFSKPPSLSMTSTTPRSSGSNIFNQPPTLSLADSAIITSPPSSTAASPSLSSPRTTTERDADAIAADPDTSFTHNDLSPSNIIVSPDFERPVIRALIDWEQAGWIGVKTAGMIHRRWRADVEEEDEDVGEQVSWKDLYEFDWRDEERSAAGS